MNVLIAIAIYIASVQLSDVRALFAKASEDEVACEQLSKMTDGYTMDYKPVIYAYHAAAEMTMANHVTWPGTKLSYFNGGMSKLERVIEKYSSNVELRYVRFAVQSGSPSFLGYKDDMQKDEAFIRKNINKTSWSSPFKSNVLRLLDKY